MSGSTNVNVRGDQGQFTHMSLNGDMNTQAAYKQHKVFTRILLTGGTDALNYLPSPGILIRADPGNTGPVFVGGIGDDAAYINKTYQGDNHGFPLFPGESWTDPVTNANLITVAGNKNDMIYVTGWLNQPTDVQLSTDPPPQYLPPVLQSSTPANNTTGVGNISTITAVFSQPLDPTTVNTTNITMSPQPAGFAVAVDTNNNPNQIDITTTALSLTANTAYTITFGTGLASLPNGFQNKGTQSITFTTDIAPSIQSTTPTNGAVGVTTNTVVNLVANRTIDATTIGAGDITVSPALTGVSYFVDAANHMQIDLTHSTNFSPTTTYTISMTAGTVLDTLGFSFPSFSFSFTSSSGTSNVAPTVVSVTPTSNATGVIPLAASIVIHLVFSEAMDGTTINNTNITLKHGATNDPSTVTLGGDNVTVTIVPNSDLLTSTQYTITATTAVKAAAGVGGLAMASQYTSTFTTEAAPTVSSFNPANAATGVATNVHPTVTFAQAMQDATVTNTSNIFITGVTSTLAVDATHKIVTITPTSPSTLANSTSYVINVTNGCKQTDGVPLASTVTSTFTTITNTPTVTATSPVNGATSVSAGVDPTITFSLAMDSSTINTTNCYLTDPNNANVAASVALDGTGKIATITPTNTLTGSSTYTIHATTGCKAGGIALASNFTSTFTTAAPTYTLVFNFSTGSCSAATFDGGSSHIGFGVQLQDTTAVNPGDSTYPLYGAKIKKVVAQLKTTSGSISGTIYCRIRNSSGTPNVSISDPPAATIGSVNANTITSSYTGISFINNSNTYALKKYDCILIEWPGNFSTASGLELGCNHDDGGWNHGGNMFIELQTGKSVTEVSSSSSVALAIYV